MILIRKLIPATPFGMAPDNLLTATSHTCKDVKNATEWGMCPDNLFFVNTSCDTLVMLKNSLRECPSQNIASKTDLLYSDTNWAHSEGHPHAEGTFTGTLVKVGDLRRNSGECQGGSHEYGVAGSPNFARLRQSSHEGALMLPMHPGICLNEDCWSPVATFMWAAAEIYYQNSCKSRFRKS